MSTLYDIVIVGAGIVGLATAREILARYPDQRIAVVEKETSPGQHQSGHNSGVLHAGVYYQPGSLKAELCVDGKARMERFAQEHGIRYETCGKVIVATHEGELDRLSDLERRGRANGVQGLRLVEPDELGEIEPFAVGVRALHVPGTGIIDFGQVVTTLHRLLAESGVDFHLGTRVTGAERRGEITVIRTDAGEILTQRMISCAGLHSDRVARMDAPAEVAIIPFRGDYYTLRPEASHLCRGLIYPVPDPSLPFLGVHFTRRVNGDVWAGPNAVLATAREGYKRSDIDPRDLLETVRYPGFPRLARRHWRTGAREVWRDVVKAAFLRDLQRYVPTVRGRDLVFGPSGVRAQAVAPDGSLVDDFITTSTESSLHILNAPSPAATASLAIGARIAGQVADRLGLRPPPRASRESSHSVAG